MPAHGSEGDVGSGDRSFSMRDALAAPVNPADPDGYPGYTSPRDGTVLARVVAGAILGQLGSDHPVDVFRFVREEHLDVRLGGNTGDALAPSPPSFDTSATAL